MRRKLFSMVRFLADVARMGIRVAFVVIAMLSAFTSMPAHAKNRELNIAAASDLQYAITEVAEMFQKASGVPAKVSLGSSGALFAKIQNGASFDLYFSADINFPKQLEAAGLAVPGSLYRYAVGRIVFWVPKNSPIEVEKGPDVLQKGLIQKVSLPNPKHAPYGRAAVSALRHFNVYETVKDKFIFAENVSTAAKVVESGTSDFGIIALSLALAPSMRTSGRYWEVPPEAHPPLEQAAVILNRSRNQETAGRFLEFMKQPQVQEIMRHYGFTLPE